MIKKIEKIEYEYVQFDFDFQLLIINKINEILDSVNSIRKDIDKLQSKHSIIGQ